MADSRSIITSFLLSRTNGTEFKNLKGVGEKTEKLFQKVGIYDTDDLLHYYPRNYDEYETPVDIAELKEETVQAVSAAVCSAFTLLLQKAGRSLLHP